MEESEYEIENLINKLTFKDIQYLAKRGIATYDGCGKLSEEFIKYIKDKEKW